MEGNDCNKAIKIVTALAIIMFIFGASAILERDSLRKENTQLKEDYTKLVNERAKCSPLGFCIGDKVEPTDDAKRWNTTIGGVVRKIEGEVLTIDTGNETWWIVNEAWVRHAYTRTSQLPESHPNVTNMRETIEEILKQQYPNRKITYREIKCDATCIVVYSVGNFTTSVWVDKKYANEW